MSLKDAAAREAALKTLLDEVESAYKAARAETQKHLDVAAKENGTRQIAAYLPDGQQVATVSLSEGTAEAKVTDDTAFKAWVMAHFPTEIEREFVTSVRSSFRGRLLSEMTAAGATQWVDADGVVHDVPGVAIAPARARTHSVRFTKTGRSDVIDAWRRGLLAATALPQLTAGGGEPDEAA